MNINKEEFGIFLKEYLKENMTIAVDHVDKDGGYNVGKIHTVKIIIDDELICSGDFSVDE